MKGKKLIPYFISLLIASIVLGILRASGIVLGAIPTVLIYVGSEAIIGSIAAFIRKRKKKDERNGDESNMAKKDNSPKCEDTDDSDGIIF